MDILVHTMTYQGAPIISHLKLPNFHPSDYPAYSILYNNCFSSMRCALRIHPVNCCPSVQELENFSSSIYLLKEKNRILGAVTLKGNEIDDLIVAESAQNQGLGTKLLDFALYKLQKQHCSPILLHVADWNQKALYLYKKHNFIITETKNVRRT